MNRRRLVKTGLAAALLPAARGEARATVYVADMHFHLFSFGRSPTPTVALAQEMAAGKATLAAWSLVGDVPRLARSPRGFVQKGTPGRGEAVKWFEAEIGRIKTYLAAQSLKIVRTPELADWLGEDHAAVGTDRNGIANPAVTSFADLQRVLDHWERRGMPEPRLRKLAIENYARVLKRALAPT